MEVYFCTSSQLLQQIEILSTVKSTIIITIIQNIQIKMEKKVNVTVSRLFITPMLKT